jgi:hypothetical protein
MKDEELITEVVNTVKKLNELTRDAGERGLEVTLIEHPLRVGYIGGKPQPQNPWFETQIKKWVEYVR